MTLLEQIHRGTVTRPRRTLMYGVQGVGKSSWASMAERPIFIPTEDGLDGIGCDRFPLAKAYADVVAALGELYTAQHEYRTIVIDSLDWLERLIWADVCRKRGIESMEDIGYQKGYTFALTQWRDVLEGLDALRNDRAMAVILIAHCKIERFEDPETEGYDRFLPRLHKLADALIREWCDEVFFASYRVHARKTGEKFGQATHKGIGTGERIIRTTERPAHVAKNRLNLPDEIPLDYRVYAAYVRGDFSAAEAAASPADSK